MQTYYNTTGLTGPALKEAVTAAKSLEEAIMEVFKNTRRGYSPWQMHGLMIKAKRNIPVTSVRRAMTNLTRGSNDLFMTDQMIPGEYTRPEHVWILNVSKWPTITGTQQKLF